MQEEKNGRKRGFTLESFENAKQTSKIAWNFNIINLAL